MEPKGEPLDQPRKSGNKTLIIVLIVVASGGFLMLLACGGCGYWIYHSYQQDVPPAEASANAFLDDLQAGRVDAAYASTSTGFKSAVTLAQFREFLKQYQTFGAQTSRSVDGKTINNNTSGKQVVFKFTLHSPGNAMNCTVILVEEGGQWKVHHLNVP
jgi:hypothetical protein